jgi:hypothetical protein
MKLILVMGLMPDKGQKKLVLMMRIKSGNRHKELIFSSIGINVQ